MSLQECVNHCSHSNTGAFVPEGGDSEHKLPGAPAVAWLGEVKQNGVQEAVHAGERPGALINDGKQVPGLARHGQRAHHQVQRLGEVEGQEADAEHRGHHDDHPHRLLPLLPGRHGDALVGHRAAQDVGHAAVAHHHAHEGHQEAQAGQSHAVRVVICRARRSAEVITHRAVSLDPRGGKVKSGRAQGDHNQPDPGADAPRHPAAALLVPHGEGMADAHVALHADAGEEEDAAVQITEKKEEEKKLQFKGIFALH